MLSNKRLVLFDFDGTITTKDTFILFILFYHGKLKFLFGFLLLLPILVLMKIKLVANWKVKELVMTLFFKNIPVKTFNEECSKFCKEILPKHIRPDALKAIQQYSKNGDTICVVSASPENWVGKWCEENNLNYLSTILEVNNQTLLTGKIEGENCYGKEKVNRILNCYTLSDYTEIIAYGDSRGDREMFAVSSISFFKPFRRRLPEELQHNRI